MVGVRACLTIDTVHGNGDGLMGFPGNGTQGHAACAEALHDILSRFHFVQVNLWADRLQPKSVPQHCHGRIVLVVLIRLVGFLHRHGQQISKYLRSVS